MIRISDHHSSKLQGSKSRFNHQQNKTSTNSSNLLDHVTKHFLRKTLPRIKVEEDTAKAISRDPCVLLKISSILDIRNFRVIVSKHHIEFEKSLSKCNDSVTNYIIKSVAVIQGDENNYENLKQNLLQYLSRDIPCYVLICNTACTSFIMTLAHTLGFASGIYVWIPIGKPAFKDDIKYPKKWIGINFRHNDFGGAKLLSNDISNLNVYEAMNFTICHQIQLITSQGEHFWFHYPKWNSFPRKDDMSKFNSPKIEPCSSHSPKATLSKFFKRQVIKVATVQSDFVYYRLDFLDRAHLACQYGLLCWVFPSGNRSIVNQREPNCCLGLTIDIFLLLKDDLDVDIYLYEAEDGKYGSNVNGSWNGLIGEVVSGRADVAGDYLSITEARMTAVDFVNAFHVTDMIVASKLQLSQLNFLNFEVFSFIRPQFWVLILSTTLIASVIIYFSEKFVNSESTGETWLQFFIYSIGLLVQRDVGGSIPRYLGSRTISIVLAITMMITMTTYVAVLATKNITTKKILPISGLNDQKVKSPTPNFKIGTWKDSAYSQMFERSQNPVWRRFGQFMKPYNFNNLEEALNQLQKGTIHAIIANTISLTLMWNRHNGCDIQFEKVITHDHLAFAITKGPYWKAPMSNLIQMYIESGKLASFERKWLSSNCDVPRVDLSQKFGMLYLSGACCMIVFGVFISGVVFIFEYVCFTIKKKKSSAYSVTCKKDITVR